jgi:hypothetical protein
MGGESQGIYGFRLIAPQHRGELPDLSPQDGQTTDVKLEWRHASALVERNTVAEDRVSLAQRGRSSLEVRREPASITVELTEPATPETLIHPLLTPPIAILARWRGDLTLHAGSFFANDRAWAVVGAREAGKSTTLAMLAARGVPLLADDLLVLDEGVVRAGPTCIDLRPDVAERMQDARYLGVVAGRPRYRLSTPPGPARAKLGGLFLLEWGEAEKVEIEPVPTEEALKLFYKQEYVGLIGPGDPRKILDLLGTPTWRVRRPADWKRGDEALDRLLEVAAAG